MTRPRTFRLFAAVCAVTVVAALTLGPGRFVAPMRWVFLSTVDALAAPVYLVFPDAEVDQVLNVALFVPLGVTLALLLPRRLWWAAILAGAALSATVEYFQAVIPGRVPDGADIVWNTVGAAVGVALVAVPRLLFAAAHRVTAAVRRDGPTPQRGSATRT